MYLFNIYNLFHLPTQALQTCKGIKYTLSCIPDIKIKKKKIKRV